MSKNRQIQKTKKEEAKMEEQKVETTAQEATETEQTAEQVENAGTETAPVAPAGQEKKGIRILGFEIRKVDKKEKAPKEPEKQGQKWGLGKTVTTIACVGLAAKTGLKVAGMILDAVNGKYTVADENGMPSYEQQAIDGQYRELDAPAQTTVAESVETIEV